MIISSDLSSIRGFRSVPKGLDSIANKVVCNPFIQSMLGFVGSVGLEVSDCEGFKAKWCWGDRKILLSSQFFRDTEANKVASLVFELSNAFQTSRFKELVRNKDQYGVEAFVRAFEEIEYDSAKITQRIAGQILGSDKVYDFKLISQKFSEHYALNQISGHSEWIAKKYFPEKAYRGTLACPLSELDESARSHLYNLLYFRSLGDSGADEFSRIMGKLDAKRGLSESIRKAIHCAEALFCKSEN